MSSALRALRKLVRPVARRLRRDPHGFLRRVSGVVHVGANSGQERRFYERLGLHVAWVEPIPAVFEELEANLKDFPKQRAYRYLLTDRDDQLHEFHLANNAGQSSSLFELDLHRDIWPEVDYEGSIELRSHTLATLVERERIDLRLHDALVLDTQGSELLVLKGAGPLLRRFRYVQTEVADFEAYRGCCQLPELERFLRDRGFREHVRTVMAVRPQGGSYYEIVYRRRD